MYHGLNFYLLFQKYNKKENLNMYVIIVEVRKKKKRYNKGYLYTKGNYKIFVISRDDGV